MDSNPPTPPVATQHHKRLEIHDHVRVDPYYWLNQRDDPEVIKYLEEENAYTDAMMASSASLRQQLFQEIVGRIAPEDETVPFRMGDYFYVSRFVEGSEYPLYFRRKEHVEAPDELMLDVNALAEGHEYFHVGAQAVSHGQHLLAYAVDNVGRRIYEVRFKNLATGQELEDVLPNCNANFAWANNDEVLFYARQDPDTLRSFQIVRHTIGTPAHDDVVVFEETDDQFSTYVFKSKSRAFLFIGSFQTVTSEWRFLSADDPKGAFRIIAPRRRDHEYDVEHAGNQFVIRTNLDAPNFRLVRADVGPSAPEEWEVLVDHRSDVLLESVEIFQDHYVTTERRNGLVDLVVHTWDANTSDPIAFDEPAYLVRVGVNREFDSPALRFVYTSLTTPLSTYDYDFSARTRTLLKRDRVVGDFDPANYRTERLHVTARDGVSVPVSLVYRRGISRDAVNPLLLYGYGAYGITVDASFSIARLSLLDRGFVFAIAHIRGGEDLGRAWYDAGRMLNKKNTFNDFIDVAEYLVNEEWTSSQRLFAMGGSAGGLLMGTAVNHRPDLFCGVVAQVPFVDIVTTMLDDTLPLTTGEYDEWGDPRNRDAYEYILSYSPYDNVEPKDYPHLLVTTGLHDSQVQYWEPAKWVAKLRTQTTSDHLILLHTNLEAGHGGASGRFRPYREVALVYSFLLKLAGRAEAG